MELISNLEKIFSFVVPLIFAITSHEVAHGYFANLFGDSTAKKLGRLTLNPIPHGAFSFGYAKPVPVKFNNLFRPKLHMIYVALAGPLANFIQAIFWSLIYVMLEILYPTELSIFKGICSFGILINILLFVINLFPLPPIDGGRILLELLPRNLSEIFSKIEPYGFIFIILFFLAGLLNEFWIEPLMNLTYKSLNLFTYQITFILN
ncbi:MAG: site-2 protease family protein [Burkholderiaceae bacterium]